MLGYNICFSCRAQNVPHELKEAAWIDGASTGDILGSNLPMLSPTQLFLVFVNTVYAFFQSFGMIDVVTQGGPTDPPSSSFTKSTGWVWADGKGKQLPNLSFCLC